MEPVAGDGGKDDVPVIRLGLVLMLLVTACSPPQEANRPIPSGAGRTTAPSTEPPDVGGPWTLAFATEKEGRRRLDVFVTTVPSGEPRRIAGVAGRDDFSPSLSPDGRWVAFRRNPARGDEGDIYVVRTRGGEAVNLTHSPGIADWSPVWSPSGDEIAYASNVEDNLELWVMSADGSRKHRLTDDPAIDEYPTWSPDGSRLAFNSTRDGQYDVWVMDATGRGASNLTHDSTSDDKWPAWSPDGEWIAFASNRDGSEDVFVARSDGSDVRNLTATPDRQESHPAWLPNGTLTFSRHGESGPISLWAVSIEGGSEVRIETDAEPVFVYGWGPT